MDEVVKGIKRHNFHCNMLEKSDRLDQIKKIALKKQKLLRKKRNNDNLNSNTSLSNQDLFKEDRSRNASRPDINVSFPCIVVTASKYTVDRSKISVLKSHRGQRPSHLKLDHNANMFLK